MYKLNHINMILYNTGSQSPGDDKPEEPDQHDVIKLDHVQQTLYQKYFI